MVEGVKTVTELLNSTFIIRDLYCSEDLELDVRENEFERISEKELGRISSLKNPNKVLAVAEIPNSTPIDWSPEMILMLDSIRDPGNLGTIIRTAKWFGVDTIICSEDCADIYNPKVVQSAMGALFHVNIHYGDLSETLEKGMNAGFRILSATMTGPSIYGYRPTEQTILIIGSESHGVSEALIQKSHHCITIPNGEKEQKVESLNASTATALILSELTRATHNGG